MSKEPGCLSGMDFVGYLLKIHLYLVWQSHCVMKTLHLQFELDLPLGISWMQSRNMDTISTPSQGYCPEGGCCTERLSDSNSDPHLDSPFSSLLNCQEGKELCRSRGKWCFEAALCCPRDGQLFKKVFSLFLLLSRISFKLKKFLSCR